MQENNLQTMLLEINAEKDITIRILRMKIDELTREINALKGDAKTKGVDNG
ncbi:MAG: hypothetical protein BWY95_02585 [Bacteroidetes bacterium ADurb.BinA104]|nr:MAG: hypothetical protein BWY95_02585 [Bacteroidetes bacterium ADurb.BinA104]